MHTVVFVDTLSEKAITMKPTQIDRSLIKALLYGAPGTTKTRTAASAVFVPEMNPVLILESAANPLSIREYDPEPYVVTMESMKDYNWPYDYLLTGQQDNHPFASWLKSAGLMPDEPFKTVIIDGITETQRFAFRAVVPDMDVRVGDVPPQLEIQNFNRILAMMTNWASKFIKLPIHVILTSLEAEKQAGSMTEIYRRPLLWGQSQGEVTSYVYMVMRLSAAEYMDSRTKSVVANDLEAVKQSSFIGFLKQSSSFYAKEQYGMFNKDGSQMRYMFDPTMQKIWDIIYNGS